MQLISCGNSDRCFILNFDIVAILANLYLVRLGSLGPLLRIQELHIMQYLFHCIHISTYACMFAFLKCRCVLLLWPALSIVDRALPELSDFLSGLSVL